MSNKHQLQDRTHSLPLPNSQKYQRHSFPEWESKQGSHCGSFPMLEFRAALKVSWVQLSVSKREYRNVERSYPRLATVGGKLPSVFLSSALPRWHCRFRRSFECMRCCGFPSLFVVINIHSVFVKPLQSTGLDERTRSNRGCTEMLETARSPSRPSLVDRTQCSLSFARISSF